MEKTDVYEIETSDTEVYEIEERISSSDTDSDANSVSQNYKEEKTSNDDYKPPVKIIRIEKCYQNKSKTTKSRDENIEFDEGENLGQQRAETVSEIDINQRLKRWATQAEIAIPKLNSLLRILRQYHSSLPYNARDLLGEEEYEKLRNKSSEILDLTETPRSINEFSNLIQSRLSLLEENVKNHLNLKIGKLKRIIDTELNGNNSLISIEYNIDDVSTSKRLNHQTIMNKLPITEIDKVDEIEDEIKHNKEFRRNFMETLEHIKGNDNVQKFLRNIFSDEVLSKFTLNKRSTTDKKVVTDYNLFLVAIYDVLRDQDQSLNDYLKILRNEIKKARDRIGANIRFKKLKLNKIKNDEIDL